MKRQAGFTLIEIAIVLVIIGLLLGGVLKGQEMINNSKVKRVVNDFNGVAAAIYSYLDRYGAFPGDDSRASTRWAGAPDGNGDGIVAGVWNPPADDEASRLWVHLRHSGLVSGDTANNATGGWVRPTNGFGGNVGVEDTRFGLTGPVICMGRIDGRFAAIIDQQMDDGIGTTGRVRGNTNQAGNGSQAYVAGTITNICSQL